MYRRAAAATMVLALAACTADSPSAQPDNPGPASEPAPAPSESLTEGPTRSPTKRPTPTRTAPEPAELVIVSHATRPLQLTSTQAERIKQSSSWRRLTVARGPRAVRRVERDRNAIAVVPVDQVGPTVAAATVDGRDPLRRGQGVTTLTVVGDLMLVRGVRDARAALAPMASRLRGADITIGNLESTLSTNGAPTQGTDSFGGHPGLVAPLERVGFDALSLANNHVGDYGATALRETLETMRRSRIRAFGAGRNREAASRPAYLERDGTTFAFLGFNAIGETPRATPRQAGALSVRMPPRTGPLQQQDLDHVMRVIRRADRRADVTVVLPHWGTQYTHTPEPVQRRVARQLVRAGADLVVGGHPHWVQGVEIVDDVPVVHSLGNYIFDMDFMEQTMEGVVLEATFHRAELKSVRFVPYRLDPATFAPRPDPRGEALRDLFASSTGPFRAP